MQCIIIPCVDRYIPLAFLYSIDNSAFLSLVQNKYVPTRFLSPDNFIELTLPIKIPLDNVYIEGDWFMA